MRNNTKPEVAISIRLMRMAALICYNWWICQNKNWKKGSPSPTPKTCQCSLERHW